MGAEQVTIEAFMDAVTNAYGKDIWTGITSNAEFYGADFASKVTQIDGVTAMYNNAGNVVYYSYNGQIVGAAESVGSAINSNVGTAVSSMSANLPANTTVAAGTGEVVATTGMKTVATGATVQTVVKDVAVGVGAVAAGLQAGALIDQIAYNINPDFWDENGMGTMDPTTWADICCDTETGKKVFNFVFGIDTTSNKVQAYMDQEAYAYAMKYMLMNGVFSSSEVYPEDPTIDTLFTQEALDCVVFPIQPMQSYYMVTTGGDVWESGTSRSGLYFFLRNNSAYPGGDTYSILAVSDSPDPITQIINGREFTVNLSPYSFNGHTWYWNGSAIGTISSESAPGRVSAYTGGGDAVLAYYTLYGTGSEQPTVPGMSHQTGATLPTSLDPDASVDDTLAALQLLYPELFADAIYNDVVQPDGTIKRITYIPVPTPEEINVGTNGEIQPSGGTATGSTQADPAVDPTQTPDSVIDTLLKLLQSTNPYNPTQTPPNNPTEYPDTGSGNTPAVVTPTGSAQALYSIYNPTQGQLNSFGAWLWSSNFVDQLLKVFNDPMQAIIGLHKIFATPSTGSAQNIKVGYLDSGVSSATVTSQYTEVDCGSVDLKEYFGNALDYTHTDIYLYLPFIGIVPLNVVDVMRATINVVYKVDVLTGACLASVNVYRDNNAGGQLYTYSGNCAVQYPLSSGSYVGIVSGVLGIAGSVAGTIATGGALLPMALGAGAAAMRNAKTQVEHSGSISGNAGAMGIKKPYLIIRRPQTLIADGFENFDGIMNNKTIALGSCTGYTRVKYMHLVNIPATGPELDAIEGALSNGIFI